MGNFKGISDQVYALRLPLFMTLFAAILFMVPGQTLEIYRALAQSMATWKFITASDYLAVRLEIGLAVVGVVMVSLVLWIAARRAAATYRLEEDGDPEIKERMSKFEYRPALLLWLPRLMALVPALAMAAGINAARVPTKFEDSVREKMTYVFKLQEIRDGMSDRLAGLLADRHVTAILSFDGYMANFVMAMVAIGLLVFAIVVLADRPALARLLARPGTGLAVLASSFVLALIAGSIAVAIMFPVRISQTLGSLFIMSLFLVALQLSLLQLQLLRQRTGIPFTALLVISAIVYSLLDVNDNHPVRSVERTAQGNAKTVTVEEAVNRWMGSRKDAAQFADKPYPVFIVAAQGGGIYAAKHASSFLAEIQDLCPGFSHHLFAISGVSGGSVGASIFGALAKDFSLQETSDLKKYGCVDDFTGKRKAYFADAVTSIFQKDLWSPLAAGLLFPDFLQRFIFYPFDSLDRARWLDYAVEDAYDRGIAESGFQQNVNASARPLAGSYMDSWNPERYSHAPALILNTTEVASGERLVVSPFKFSGAGLNFLPVWDEGDEAKSAKYAPVLSSAAGLSARFPWITPAAYFHRLEVNSKGETENKKIRVVDGGYFENSGVATSLDLIKEFVNVIGTETGRNVEINLLVFTSAKFDTPEAKSLGELIDPIRTMFSTRGARAGIAIGEALAELRNLSTERSTVNANVIKLELDGHEYPLPLGWRLSPVTRHLISFQNGAEGTCEQDIETVMKSGGKLEASCAKRLIYERLK
ncbi:MAG: hypothetical protein K0U74_04020 [Alphaproteobacteria bacterium]|nr:hypothetical protein [Alphaproteobacteria bacterium]